jgi:tetratricopeptide (TPR) repeat protein
MILFFQIQKYEMLGSISGQIPKDIVNYPYTESSVKLPATFLILFQCIKMTFLPHPLSYDYSYNQVPAGSFSSAFVLLGLLIAIALAYFSFKGLMKKSPLTFGVLIFCITLAPALAFVFLRGGIFAERFLYEPSLGFCIVVVYLFQPIPTLPKGGSISSPSDNRRLRAKLLEGAFRLGFLFLLFSLYSFKTITRNPVWHDNLSLFSTDVNTSPNSCQVQRHYGSVLIDMSYSEKDSLKRDQLLSKGIEHLKIALRINPNFSDALFKLGYAYQDVKVNNDSAIFYYNRAIEVAPGSAMAYNNLGVIYENMGSQELASYYFNKTVEVNPYFTQGILNRNSHRKRHGLDVHQFPSKLTPEVLEKMAKNKDAMFYFKLGTTLSLHEDYVRGAKYLEKAVEMDPKYEQSYLNLATCYGMQKQYDKALEILNRLLKINPNNLQGYNFIAITYDAMGNKEKAKEYTDMVKKLTAK